MPLKCLSLYVTYLKKSLSSGVVPKEWRKANVIPVHKANSKEKVENYRPISLLSVLSKICERCVHNQIYAHVAPQLNDFQHGFLKGRSTCTQLIKFVNKIGMEMDNSGQTDIVYLDFSKAFDSVPHKLMIHKLETFGINGNILE